MKKRSAHWLRSALCLMLAVLLAAGTCVTAFAEEAAATEPADEVISYDVNGDGEVKYISLGESMTNGYGTEGYYPGYYSVADGYWWAEKIDRMDRTNSTAYNAGTNTFGYMQSNVTTYASLFADYLADQTEEKVTWYPLAISGQRPEDFYWLMQDGWTTFMDAGKDENQTLFEADGTYNGDMYTTYVWKNGNNNEAAVSRFLSAKFGRFGTYVNSTLKSSVRGSKINGVYENTAWYSHTGAAYYDSSELAETELATFREEYRGYIADADIISVNLGTHSFSSVVSQRLLSLFTGTTDLYNDGRANMSSLIAYYPEYETYYQQIKAMLHEYLDPYVAVVGADVLEGLIEVYGYATLSFMITYDESLSIIRELNPDAQIVVMGMSNFLEGLRFDMGDGLVLDLGAIFGALVEFTNLYRAYWVEDAKDCIFAPAVDNMDLLIDELARGETNIVYLTKMVGSMAASWDFKNDVVNTFLGSTTNQQLAVEYLYTGVMPEVATEEQKAGLEKVYEVYKALKEVASDENFDGGAALEMFGEGGMLDMSSACNKLTTGELTAAEKIAVHLWVRCFMGEGVGCHPSTTGHAQVAAVMIENFENGYTGTKYVADKVAEALRALVDVIEKYGPDAVKEAWDYANEAGYLDAVDTAVQQLMEDVAEQVENFNELTKEDVVEAIAELNAKLAVLDEELASKSAALTDGMLEELEALETLLKAKKAEYEAAGAAVASDIADVIAEVEAAIAGLKAQIDATETAIESIKTEIAEVKAQIEALEASLEAIEEALNEMVEAAELVQDAVEDLFDSGLDTVAADIDAVVKSIETMVGTVIELSEAANEAVAEAGETVETIDSAVVTIANEIVSLFTGYVSYAETTVGGLVDSVTELTDDLDAFVANLSADVTAAVEALENQLKVAVETINAETEAAIARATETIETKIAETQASLEAKLAERDGAIDPSLLTTEEQLLLAIAALKTTIEENEALIEEIGNSVEEEFAEEIAEANAKIEAAKAELAQKEAELAAVQAQIAAATAEIDAAIKQLQDEIAALNAELEAKVNELRAEAEAKIAAAKAEIDPQIEALLAQVDTAMQESVAALIDALETANEDFESLVEAVVELKDEFEAEIIAKTQAAVEAATELVSEQLAALDELILENVEALVAALELAYSDAVSSNYVVTKDSFLVSVGDESAASESFAELLAEELNLGENFVNLAKESMSCADLLEELQNGNMNYLAPLAQADLITVSFNPTTYATEQVEKMMSAAGMDDVDWTKYVTEAGVPYVEAALDYLYEYLVEQGLPEVAGMDIAQMATDMVEAYTYSIVEYVAHYAILVNAIHEVNPIAEVILVGAYNSFDDMTIVLEDADLEFPLGDMMEQLVALTNMHHLAYASVAGNTTYVAVPDTETVLDEKAIELGAISGSNIFSLLPLSDLLRNIGDSVVPSEEGHEYIKDCILSLLTIGGLLGDVNGDGEVNTIDAALIAKYDAKLIGATDLNLGVGDVNGDGEVNTIDAALIAKYDAKLLDAFPAA